MIRIFNRLMETLHIRSNLSERENIEKELEMTRKAYLAEISEVRRKYAVKFLKLTLDYSRA